MNFILIRNLCVVDLLGALLILPVPLVVTALGGWRFGPSLCTANSVVNLAIWFQGRRRIEFVGGLSSHVVCPQVICTGEGSFN